MHGWQITDAVVRLAVLVLAAVAIPTYVWRRSGGRTASYAALTIGLVCLIVSETLQLVLLVAPEWSAAIRAVNIHLPTQAGGYLLVLVGFLSLMRDMQEAQGRASRSAANERLRAEEARLQETRLRAVLNCATEYCIIGCDLQGRVTSYSTGGARIFGWDADEVVGRMNVAAFHTDDGAVEFETVLKTVRDRGCFEAEVPMRRKSGETFPALLTVTPLTDATGNLDGYVGIVKDITALKDVENALRRERDFVQGIIETNELFIMGLALADGAVTMFNHGAERISGYRRDEVIGRPYREVLLRPEDRAEAVRLREQMRTGEYRPVGTHEHAIVTKNGEHRFISWTYTVCCDASGRPADLFAFGHDVTEQRQMQGSLEKAKGDLERANAELARLASTDALTGLLNRRQAELLFEHAVAAARRNGTPVGVILIDLDRFKSINDTHGHDAGDAVLRHVADRLRARLRASDIAARYGGEEFLVILPETGLDGATRIADDLRRRIQEKPILFGNLRLHVTASCGVTVLVPGQNLAVEKIVRMADEAMYCAKNLGGNRVVTWNSMNEGKVEPSLVASPEVQVLQKRVAALARRNRTLVLDNLYQLVDELEAPNPYTEGHAHHVTAYAVSVARELGLSEAEIEGVHRAAMLQDLGMAALSKDLLWKNEPLSRSDWTLVCQHPVVSVKLIERLPYLQREAFFIRHHHERPDGRGYPDGLTGDAIPLEARILAVADALDAMTRPRPYRPALSLQEALGQLRSGAPEQFDAVVVDAAWTAAEKAAHWSLASQAVAAAGAATPGA